MDDSILNSVKKKVNLGLDNDEFDDEIIDYINSAFATLHQLGIGPIKGFAISNASATWDSFLQGDNRFNSVKELVAKKVRLAFDPPSTSFHIKAMQDVILELETRLNIVRESTLYGAPVYIPAPDNGGSGPSLPDDGILNGGTPFDSDDGITYNGGTP
jgi:hypothetical protein